VEHRIVSSGSPTLSLARLIVEIRADGMKSANITAEPIGGVSMTQKRNVRSGPNFYSAEIPSPRGAYIITVETTKLTKVYLDASF
jgi:hypothetical protein